MRRTSIRSIFGTLLSFIGLAFLKDLLTTKKENQILRNTLGNKNAVILAQKDAISTLDRQLAEERSSLAVCEATLKRLYLSNRDGEWISPSLIEFQLNTPYNFQKNTYLLSRDFVRGEKFASSLICKDHFSSPGQCALYWSLTHASKVANEAARAAKNENGISRSFLDALDRHVKLASAIPGVGPLQLAYNSIFEQCSPGMTEKAVGADILLVVAGNSLIPNGLARVFWIQAKRAESELDPYKLVFDQKNKDGYQIDALKKVSKPLRGAFGLYMQYSTELPFVPAVDVLEVPRHQTKMVADLSEIGARLPELIVSCTKDHSKYGAFKNKKELLTYLDECSGNKPINIVVVCSDSSSFALEMSAHELLLELTAHYRKELERSLKMENGISMKRQQNRDLGLDLF